MSEPTASSSTDPLQQSLRTLQVTPTRRDQLARLGLETVGDLLFHFPRFYEDLTRVTPMSALVAGQTTTVQGEIVEIEGRQLDDGRRVVSVVLSDDGKHVVEGVWFNQPGAARGLRYGQRLAFSGKPKWHRDGWRMTHPRLQRLDGSEDSPDLAVVPVYPLTEDLRVEQLRAVIRKAVDRYAGFVPDVLPPTIREQHGFPDVKQAMEDIHFPTSLSVARTARRRFVYEEFLVLQVALACRRREVRDRQRAPVLTCTPQIDARIRKLFPFALTPDQDRAAADVVRNLASDRPMQRLLQADVGAGKTAVAVYALLVTVANRHQAVLMAPTEVLARQHHHTLERYLAHSRVRRLLLTGGLTAKQRRDALAAIRAGEVDLVVGTQALLSDDVEFAKLGLVVIDEQHKFGVNQRAQIRRLGVDPHYLVMTATPIPRTMALTVFGDLDVSVIRQMPPGRQPVRTRWCSEGQREKLYDHLRQTLRDGRQLYVVCPLVEESAALDVKAATQTHAELQAGAFHEFRVGLLHGRMEEEEKDRVMVEFRERQLDVLVSTSVIEVGVDVPNATLMVIEHAERFGLSQLHQLRGRVSRGETAGECYLFSDPTNEEARERLRVLVRTTDGFALAEEDARQRGLGQFFGTRQHGLGELRIANWMTDQAELQSARRDALTLVAADAGLRRPEHELLRRTVLARYGGTLDLAAIG